MKRETVVKEIFGQTSFVLETVSASLAVTKTGGHMAPVEFKGAKGNERPIAPYAIAPWWNETIAPDTPPIIKVLRGDFFCLPFGGNETPFNGEKHPVHGEVANNEWSDLGTLHGNRGVMLELEMQTRIRPGIVRKRLALVAGQEVVYCQHCVQEMEGPMCYGHHACIKFPDKEGAGLISIAPFVYGQVFPEPVETEATQGRSVLQPGAEFLSLHEVPLVTGGTTDLSRYPARRGYEDIAMVIADPQLPMGWTAVSFPEEGYVWFALKDPKVLTGTVMWISNGGRDAPPWNGRHINVMGLEDVTSYFHPGLAESVGTNPFQEKGFQTFVHLSKEKPLVVNYIMGIARLPEGFGYVAEVQPAPEGVRFVDDDGRQAFAAVSTDFLTTGDMASLIGE